jgi:hypothetical protein
MDFSERYKGFSLIEVMLAACILTIGYALIAMVFPASIKLTGMASEKVLVPAIADEARAIVRLYEVEPEKLPAGGTVRSVLLSAEYLTDRSLKYFFRRLVYPEPFDVEISPLPSEGMPQYAELMATVNEQLKADALYPSLPKEYFLQRPSQNQRYCWSVLCRKDRSSPAGYQICIFVCRRAKELRYYGFTSDQGSGSFTAVESERPMPLPFRVSAKRDSSRVTIHTSQPVNNLPSEWRRFFLEGAWIAVDQGDKDERGYQVYQIIQRYENTDTDTVTLSRKWQGSDGDWIVWLVPPAVGMERNVCIGVL